MIKKKILFAVLVASVLTGGSVLADLLMKVDFSGTGPNAVGTIASTDSQITLSSAATFTDPALAVNSIGGGTSTSAWVYDGTGTAAANTDLHTASTFGSPTRFDIDLGLAATGYSYTITTVQIVVRASNSAGTQWDFGYRDGNGTAQVISGGSIATQSGANPFTTYTIDLTGEGLTATDSAVAWNTTGTGRLRVMFFEPTADGNDNLQVDAILINGTVVPEPATIGMLGVGALITILIRKMRV